MPVLLLVQHEHYHFKFNSEITKSHLNDRLLLRLEWQELYSRGYTPFSAGAV
jgi:hypothetical protein